MDNPYRSPDSPVVDNAAREGSELVASGQKLVIYAILTYFATAVVRGMMDDIGSLVALAALGLVALGLAVLGIVRLGQGLGLHIAVRVLCVALMFVPLVGLIMLLVLNGMATRRLKAAGYKVGLAGARPG